MTIQCLIIGYGSIGKRHANVLKSLGCDITIVSSQQIAEFNVFNSLEVAFENKRYDYVIIANATHLHYETLTRLIACDYRGMVLVEKPLFAKLEKLPANNFSKIIVAYNLRFHQLLQQAKQIIKTEKLITFSAYVGQYLPTWRKETDYRECYSAKKELGGGVLRDLSHELDYSLWFCGPLIDATAIGGHYSELEINSDDVYSILMRCKRCPIVNIQVNYLDRHTRREVTINTDQNTLYIDFMKGILSVNGEVITQCNNGVAQTYIKQHESILNKEFDNCCSYEEGLAVMQLIDGLEQASTDRKWMVSL